MIVNRSVPPYTVIPVLAYADVVEAIDWLCDVFGFTERLRIGNHRAQLVFGEGAVIVTELRAGQRTSSSEASHSLLVHVDDVDRHYEHARQRGPRILQPPADYSYGERQYTVEDIGGHVWTFSQSIADVAPEEWGGTLVKTNQQLRR